MSLHLVPLLQSWSEIREDFALNWLIYLSMPFIAALIGYGTKIVALEMMYHPLEFKGVGFVGWQGVVPRRAGKMAATTIEMLTERLLKPEEILERIDAAQAVDELRVPLARVVDELAAEFVDQLQPGLWHALPGPVRSAIRARVHHVAPRIIDEILDDVRADLTRYVDVHFLAVSILVHNKPALNQLIRGVGGSSMAFVRRSGIYFGLAIGLVQVLAWALVHSVWIMPVFGFVTGFFSDYIALNLLFFPQRRIRLLGIFPFQGVIHARRDSITRDYARILATDIFSPAVLFDALLSGPTADRIFWAIEEEIVQTIDGGTRVASPLIKLTVGTTRYVEARSRVVDKMLTKLPELVGETHEYAAQTLDIENTIVDKMSQLSNEQFESIMRPIFKDDEKTMIAVGAILGFAVGELQVKLIEHLTR